MTGATPNELLDIDLDYLHDRVGAALAAASARLRSGPSSGAATWPGVTSATTTSATRTSAAPC